MAAVKLLFSIIMACVLQLSNGLDNGLVLKPPMGWISWERFRCITDCKQFPNKCISEKLFMEMADKMVTEGYKDAGYEYVNIDDCYLEFSRNAQGNLVADKERFPNGVRYLADYMHSKGLKLGIYEDYGNKTCGGYPGILGHMEDDAETFAEWGADMVKLDGCYSNIHQMNQGYPKMGQYMNETGRPMVYSCSWPDYQRDQGMKPNYSSIAKHCNLWRMFDDIQDSWESVTSIIDFFGDNQDILIPHAGPGHWNDPDMIIVGNYGLSYDQAKAQMAIWAILAAPLLMSNDLRHVKPEFKGILLNHNVIAVDQDELGIQGRRIYKKSNVEIWMKPILPSNGLDYSYAVAVLYRGTDGTSRRVHLPFDRLGLTHHGGYHVHDLYTNENYGVVAPSDTIYVDVNPTGVVMLKAEVGHL